MQHHIFEAPDCGMPDHSHPGDHAIKNLGTVIIACYSEMLVKAPAPVYALGVGALVLMKAAAEDPQWFAAILDAIDERNVHIVNQAAQTVLEDFPLSPLDRAMLEVKP